MSSTYPQIIISTPRLHLALLDEKHVEPVFDFSNRNRNFFAPYGPKPVDEYFTLENVRKRLTDEITLMNEKKGIRFWIFKKEDEQFSRVIGDVHFMNVVWGIFLSSHLGYKLDETEVGKGYGTEAIGAAIDFIFREWKLHRVEANIIPENKRSIRLAEKLGFINEGLSRKYLKLNGLWKDHYHYVKLNEAVE